MVPQKKGVKHSKAMLMGFSLRASAISGQQPIVCRVQACNGQSLLLLQMSDIGLLIFDECHHTHSNHPYNQIMQDFYAPLQYTAPGGRPLILALTASPEALTPEKKKRKAFNPGLQNNLNSRMISINNRCGAAMLYTACSSSCVAWSCCCCLLLYLFIVLTSVQTAV